MFATFQQCAAKFVVVRPKNAGILIVFVHMRVVTKMFGTF